MNDTCLICGRYVPEGRMVCIICEKQIMDNENGSGLLEEEDNE